MKPPKFVGMKPVEDPRVKQYRADLAARTAAGRGVKPAVKIPDINMAAALYDPKRGVMNLNDMAESQRSAVPIGEDTRLRPETIAGLQALHASMAATQKEPTKMTEPETPSETSEPIAAERPKADAKPVAVDDYDDEFASIWQKAQSDVINNSEEREAVRKLVKPIDIAEGLAMNEFSQEVPIGPMTVTFRTVQPLEIAAIRAMIFRMVDEGKVKDHISGDLYSLMTVVASVKRINKKVMPDHVVPDGAYRKFDEDIFGAKYREFETYPLPMVHAISTHSSWFDLRVRETFRNGAAIKNG